MAPILMDEKLFVPVPVPALYPDFRARVRACASGQKLVCIKKRDMRQGTRDDRDERDERDESDRDNGTWDKGQLEVASLLSLCLLSHVPCLCRFRPFRPFRLCRPFVSCPLSHVPFLYANEKLSFFWFPLPNSSFPWKCKSSII